MYSKKIEARQNSSVGKTAKTIFLKEEFKKRKRIQSMLDEETSFCFFKKYEKAEKGNGPTAVSLPRHYFPESHVYTEGAELNPKI